MVLDVRLGIINPEEMADSRRANQNPTARNEREKKWSHGQSPGITYGYWVGRTEGATNEKPKELQEG